MTIQEIKALPRTEEGIFDLKKMCIRDRSWEKDPATGRMKMQEIAGSEQILDAEIVLIAAGFLGCLLYTSRCV